jgi:hypothetical protein
VAGFGADAAVFVHMCVPFALLSAYPAGCPTGIQKGRDDLAIGAGLTGQDASGDGANVRAVQIRPDAAREFGDHVLGKTRVSAPSTGLGAFEARSDAGGELFLIQLALGPGRVGVDHPANMVGHILLLASRSLTPPP